MGESFNYPKALYKVLYVNYDIPYKINKQVDSCILFKIYGKTFKYS